MEFEAKSKVYIKTDTEGSILRCEGGYTTPADLTGWIEIDEGTGDRYNLCQSHYFDGGLYTMDGIPRYRWDGSKAILRTEEEMEADRAALPKPEPPAPTDDTLEARVAALEADAEQAALDRAALALLLTGEETV